MGRYVISIDGACRRNGKPDCVSSGGVFIQYFNNFGHFERCGVGACYEKASTNQRGELHALLVALNYIAQETDAQDDIQIVTDSEYLFNAMTKTWFVGWASRGWLTASMEPVKNADLWMNVSNLYQTLLGRDINYYHIKGHCISFGRVTADRLLNLDCTGNLLLQEIYKKFDESVVTKQSLFSAAQKLSARNNGFPLPEDVFRNFVVANTVADAVATKEVDAADARS